MIKVVVDIRDLQIATTGTKTFLEEVCKELERGHSGFQFYFLSPKGKPYCGANKILKIKEHLLFFIWKWETGNWIIWTYNGEGFNFL